jgi:hypothetical protein
MVRIYFEKETRTFGIFEKLEEARRVRDIALKITVGNWGKKEDVFKDAMDAVV